MRKLFRAPFIAVSLIFSQSALAQNPLDSFITAQINTLNIPGLSVAIIKNGKLAYAKGYGYANLEKQIPVQTNTVFMLASISKTVTATALMELYDQGKFKLDDSINGYLPFAVRNPSHPDVPITFRHLLTHTSCIRDNYDIIDGNYVHGDSPIKLEDYLKDYLTPGGAYYNETANFSTYVPGSRWEYCNIGATLCGYLVQRISGKPFDQYAAENVMSQVCMEHTSWFLGGLDTNLVARPYEYNQGLFYDQGLYGYPDYPDGQLRTTATSLAKFLWMALNHGSSGGKTILQPATMKEMLKVQKPAVNGTQGLIWFSTTANGKKVWGHTGGDAGVTTYMFMDTTKKTGVILLCNKGHADMGNMLNKLFSAADTMSLAGKAEIVCSLSGMAENKMPQEEITVFPNPASYSIRVNGLEFSGDAIVRLFSMTGLQIDTRTSNSAAEISIDISSLPAGMYMVYVADKGRQFRQKVIVRH